ncbi:MAG: adenylate/guanylate cyclase domain-containing protein [Chitinophagales bacterium]|nr:adenylate/guanylate cyclase domain-containing protein [Chitinophagales bacterium]
MSTRRVLSAILFADISGYTAMMQEDEKKALRLIARFKKVIERETIAYEGRVIQYYGDGCLLSFVSAVRATECAIAIQKEFLADPVVPVRIGLHLGDILFRNESAFGNGVNVASRIESMGLPGSVLVSKTIRDLISNNDFKLKSMGEFLFKNVKEPLEVFAVEEDGFMMPSRDEMVLRMKAGKKKGFNRKWLIAASAAILIVAFILYKVLSAEKKAYVLPEDLRDKPVAIMSFENMTKNKGLDIVGLMAKDWINNGLLEAGENVIIPKRGEYDDLETEKSRSVSIPEGVEVVVKGRFYIPAENQLAITAEIVNANTDKVLASVKPVINHVDSVISILHDLEEQVVGCWIPGGYTNQNSPPPLEVYQEYIQGLFLERTSPKYAQKYFEKVTEMYPSFNKPYLELLDISIRASQKTITDSLISILKTKESSFSEYEMSVWNELKEKAIADTTVQE